MMSGVTVAEDFVRALIRGDFQAALDQSTPEMRALLTPLKLAKLWHSETGSLGEFVSTQNDSFTSVDGHDDVHLTVLFSKGSLRVSVALTRASPALVAGFHRLERRTDSS